MRGIQLGVLGVVLIVFVVVAVVKFSVSDKDVNQEPDTTADQQPYLVTPTPIPKVAWNNTDAQIVSKKPDSLLATEEEYVDIKSMWDDWARAEGHNAAFNAMFAAAAENAIQTGKDGFRMHPVLEDELDGTREIWFVRWGDGWAVKKVIP